MNVPFPSHLVENADDDSKRRALEFWNTLNSLAATDPRKYRETLAATAREMKAAEKRTARDFIHPVFHMQLANVAVNVLKSGGIKSMVADEVPMLVSRGRRVGTKETVYDIVLHPSTIDRARNDTEFQAALQDLLLRSVEETHGVALPRKGVKLGTKYIGRWLWRDDGTQFTDAELEEVADLTVESMLGKLRLDGDAGAAKKQQGKGDPEELATLVLPGQSMGRVDSKAALIEEVSGSSSPVVAPKKPLIEEVSVPAPVAAWVAEPAPPVPQANSDDEEEEDESELTNEQQKFLASQPAPGHGVRVLYSPIDDDDDGDEDPGLRVAAFDLSDWLPANTPWPYASASLDPDTNVLEFAPPASSLPHLSVRFFRLGAQLLVGPRVVHATTAWIGGADVPASVEPRFAKRTRRLAVRVRF
ncbi:hypothetical protein H9P43_008874 [Blastocladiella emersonii ATCC 22665]|nr:hypothetical protein H9P43_008874 [Blastocladiella emersonii ATCC 22665]